MLIFFFLIYWVGYEFGRGELVQQASPLKSCDRCLLMGKRSSMKYEKNV